MYKTLTSRSVCSASIMSQCLNMNSHARSSPIGQLGLHSYWVNLLSLQHKSVRTSAGGQVFPKKFSLCDSWPQHWEAEGRY